MVRVLTRNDNNNGASSWRIRYIRRQVYAVVVTTLALVSIQAVSNHWEEQTKMPSYLSSLLPTAITETPKAEPKPAVRSTGSSNTKYEAVDCRSFVKKVSVDTDPEGSEKVLVRTKTEHPFLIALHKQKHDKVRWDIVTYGRYYEWGLEDVWAKILKKALPGSHIVDVGGNVGYYSLFSAALGDFVIDSFEPNPANILRFCESVGVNYWSGDTSTSADSLRSVNSPRINIWEMGLSNAEGNLSFRHDEKNPGAGRFVTEKQKPIASSSKRENRIDQIPVVTLDSFAKERGWFSNRREIEILKVDVERHEAQVLLGAKELLQSGLVKNIFTEIGVDVDRSILLEALHLLTESGYQVAGQGNFRGPDLPSPWPDDDDLVDNIVGFLDQKMEAHPYINMWWTLATLEEQQEY